MAEIGFIGLGNMGGPMAANLIEAGHSLKVFDLSQAAVAKLAGAGVAVTFSASEAANGVEAVYPKPIEMYQSTFASRRP